MTAVVVSWWEHETATHAPDAQTPPFHSPPPPPLPPSGLLRVPELCVWLLFS